MKDYYEILGVNKNASFHDIKKSYRLLAQKYHPDKNKGDKNCESIFIEIKNAYEVISNPFYRFLFDLQYFNEKEPVDKSYMDKDQKVLESFNEPKSFKYKPVYLNDLVFQNYTIDIPSSLKSNYKELSLNILYCINRFQTFALGLYPAYFKGEIAVVYSQNRISEWINPELEFLKKKLFKDEFDNQFTFESLKSRYNYFIEEQFKVFSKIQNQYAGFWIYAKDFGKSKNAYAFLNELHFNQFLILSENLYWKIFQNSLYNKLGDSIKIYKNEFYVLHNTN